MGDAGLLGVFVAMFFILATARGLWALWGHKYKWWRRCDIQAPIKKPLQDYPKAVLYKAQAVAIYMWSIMTWPKPEQLTWVAPSIKRAKS